MFNFWQRTPLAWLQLSYQKSKMLTAIAGIVFACVLMFMQFGFQEALFSTATLVHENISGDLFLMNTQSEYILAIKPFSRRMLYQAAANEQIESAAPIYVGVAPWKNPETGKERSILVFGIEPTRAILNLPGVAENQHYTNLENAAIFDRASRPEFGDVAGKIERGELVSAELNRRRIYVKGLFTLGSSFGADGNLITSDLNFLRIFSGRAPGQIDFGILNLKPGAHLETVKAEIRRVLPAEIRVLTKQEFVQNERSYWESGTPIGFVFTFGAILGLIVGIIITYQVLYTDVVNHLAEYATLKAMGYTNAYLTTVVLQEAIILSILGFVPGFVLSLVLYQLAGSGANLNISMTIERALLVFALTVGMCFVSGLIAMRKLKQADPADIF